MGPSLPAAQVHWAAPDNPVSHLLSHMQTYSGGDANAYQGRLTHLDQTINSAKQALQGKLESIRSTHTAVLR